MRWSPLALMLLAGCTCEYSAATRTYACLGDDECAQGYACVEGTCQSTGTGGGDGGEPACTTDAQCAPTERCVARLCTPKVANGQPCDTGAECQSTFCAGAVCCDTACDGSCGDCNAPGKEGVCSPVALGAAGAPACAPFLCNGTSTSCPTLCSRAAECLAPAVCSAGACVTSDLPVNAPAPSIGVDGGFYPGAELTADDGAWAASSGGAITLTRQWLRCDADGGACVPVTTAQSFSGADLQTDATRAALVDGDGLPAGSGVGTWVTGTNLIANGGLEVDSNGWGTWNTSGDAGSFPGAARDTGDQKFGAASLLVTTPGLEPSEIAVVAVSGLSSSTGYTGSAWLKAPAGAALCLGIEEFDIGGGYLGEFPASTFIANGAWQRVTCSGVTRATTVEIHLTAGTCSATGQAVSFRLDGVQLEKSSSPTPYVETGGATATRAASTLTGPLTLLDTAQSWAAFRVRPEWSAASALQPFPLLLSAEVSPTQKLGVHYDRAGGDWVLERNGGTQNVVRGPRAVSAGTSDTVIAAWARSLLRVSVNGGAFTEVTSSELPTGLGPTFSLGPNDAEFLWVAFGAGTLSSGDAAALDALGDTDPAFDQLPGTPSMLWPADGLSYLAAVTSPTYQAVAGDLGFTFRVVVTAANANGSTSVTSAAFGPVVRPPPANLTLPSLSLTSGGWYPGGVAASTQGTWSNSPTSFAFQWQRCDAAGQSCVAALGNGSTTASYTIAASDLGGTLRATVTASAAGGSTSADSNASPTIIAAPPTFRALGAGVSFASATAVTLNRPTVVDGDAVLAFLTWGASPGTVTAPTGWTQVAGSTQPTQGPAAAVYLLVAGPSEPATYPFSWTNAVTGGGATASYGQASGTAPVAVFAVGTPVLGSKTATIPGLTTTGPYQRVVAFCAINVASAFSGALGGWSVRATTLGSNPNGAVADRLFVAAGATGTTGWGNTTGGSPNVVNSLSIAVALQPR